LVSKNYKGRSSSEKKSIGEIKALTGKDGQALEIFEGETPMNGLSLDD